MALSAGEVELKEALEIALQLLQVRLDDQPLTSTEIDQLDTYNVGCWIHVSTDRYCKYCDGVVLAKVCKEGEEGLLADH